MNLSSWMRVEPLEDIDEIGPWVDFVELAALD
jgi:hypothetical protein